MMRMVTSWSPCARHELSEGGGTLLDLLWSLRYSPALLPAPLTETEPPKDGLHLELSDPGPSRLRVTDCASPPGREVGFSFSDTLQS